MRGVFPNNIKIDMKYISRKLIKAVMPFALKKWEANYGRLERRKHNAFIQDIKVMHPLPKKDERS
jgi:hypothetical protein